MRRFAHVSLAIEPRRRKKNGKNLTKIPADRKPRAVKRRRRSARCVAFSYDRNRLWVSGPQPLALGVRDLRVFAPAYRGPSTGWQDERWEERPATPFPQVRSFSRVARYVFACACIHACVRIHLFIFICGCTCSGGSTSPDMCTWWSVEVRGRSGARCIYLSICTKDDNDSSSTIGLI